MQRGRWERSYGDITQGRRRLGTDGPDTISKPHTVDSGSTPPIRFYSHNCKLAQNQKHCCKVRIYLAKGLKNTEKGAVEIHALMSKIADLI